MIDVTINDEPVDGVTILPPWLNPNGEAKVEFATNEPPPFDFDRMFTVGLFGRTFHAHLLHRDATGHTRKFSLRGDGPFPFTAEEWDVINEE
ncbi:hypothetical protein EON77_06520 [bacterium]|nr:MAG: hypothetical protein EON77_06520 [bacterium]